MTNYPALSELAREYRNDFTDAYMKMQERLHRKQPAVWGKFGYHNATGTMLMQALADNLEVDDALNSVRHFGSEGFFEPQCRRASTFPMIVENIVALNEEGEVIVARLNEIVEELKAAK